MGLVEKLLDTCIRLLQTKWERRWGIREKMIAYQDLLSLFGIFYVSPIFDIGIERRKDVQCEIVKLFCRLFILSQLICTWAHDANYV